MNRSTLLLCIAGTLAATSVAAQRRDPHEVQPERPTVATHAGTVAPGFLELEWGAEYSSGPTLSIPAYFKLGLWDRVQLGVLVPFSKPQVGNAGLGDLQVALKWRVLEGHSILGRFAIQPNVSLPSSSGATNSKLSILLISSRDIGKVAVDINAGITTSRGTSLQELWTLSLGGPLSGKWGWVGELFGTASSGSSTTSLLAGPTYRLHSWFSLDAGVIAPISPTGDLRFYVGGVTNMGRIFGK